MYTNDDTSSEDLATAMSYFRNVFESSNPREIDEALENIASTITDTINEDLTYSVTYWEVKLALFAMHTKKAHGPDEMIFCSIRNLRYSKRRFNSYA